MKLEAKKEFWNLISIEELKRILIPVYNKIQKEKDKNFLYVLEMFNIFNTMSNITKENFKEWNYVFIISKNSDLYNISYILKELGFIISNIEIEGYKDNSLFIIKKNNEDIFDFKNFKFKNYIPFNNEK